MDERIIFKILHEMGWALRGGEAVAAAKVFGHQEALACYHRGRLSFEFWSEGRNVVASACWIPKTEEEVRQACRHAEKLIHYLLTFSSGLSHEGHLGEGGQNDS